MRRLRDRIASFEPTVFDRIMSEISRFSAISSLLPISPASVSHLEAHNLQGACGSLLDLLIELGSGCKPSRHHVEVRVTEIVERALCILGFLSAPFSGNLLGLQQLEVGMAAM